MTNRTPQAYFPGDAIITIMRKGGAAQVITTEVSNFDEGGGGKDVETVAHFGNAYLTIKKSQEQFEVSFDVDVNDTTWAQVMSYDVSTSGSATKVTSGGDQLPYKIKIEYLDSEYPAEVGSAAGVVGAGYKMLFYNAYGVNFEKESAADDYLKGTISFRVSPSDENSNGQKLEIECSDFTDAAGSGSYVGWETTADTLFGY